MRLEAILTLFFSWNMHFSLPVFTPRLTQEAAISILWYEQIQKHTVLFHPEGSDDLYIGGTNIVYRFDLEHSRLVENYSLTPTGGQNCQVIPCENIITVIEQFQDSLFICGTNEYLPLCWKVYPRVGNLSSRVIQFRDGAGISPPVYTQNSLSLTVEGDLYAATALSRDGTSLQFRRKGGNRASVWMHDKWLADPTFVSASWIRQREDPDQEKIYLFFREKNLDPKPDADPWISRIARVCKVDEGGPKRFSQSIWTSFLKSRLACRIQGLYFNHLQDVFVQPADDWRASRVYALFTSSWNASAVCVYSLDKIEAVFEGSSFRGWRKEIPNPRPGACVANSKDIPVETLRIVKEHPEMSDWVWPLHQAPFYVSDSAYAKIAVDTVTAVDGRPHNVLFLATDKGIIHKILEDNFTPFVISEIRLFNHSAPVQSMKLLSNKGKLLVGFRDQVAQLDLRGCRGYGASCADCILARDPYCAWSGSACAPVVRGAIQNIDEGTVDVCHQSGTDQQYRRPPSPDPSVVSHSPPMGTPFYLSCPVRSRHASYTWEHGGRSSPCVTAQTPLQTQYDCLHLIPAVREEHYGTFECISTERNYTQVVRSYQLRLPVDSRAARPSRPAITTALAALALVPVLWH